MTVPLLDLKPQYRALKAELDAAMLQVAATQMFILGPEVRALEAEIAAYCGAKHGIGLSSGTDALLIALMAYGIGPGDEVVTSSYTFFATGGTIARVGARPVFLDIDPVDFNLDARLLADFLAGCERRAEGLFNRATGGRVSALMPVHLYGQSADMDAIMALTREYGLPVIEDAAQAIGTEWKGRRVAGIGEIGCLSFFPTKNLGAFGDAGMCVTNDDALASKLRILRVHGGEPKYYHHVIGGNFRIDEIQAAVLRVKFRHLEDWHAARQRNAAHYDRAFAAAGTAARVATPTARPVCRHIYNQYVIRVPDRDRLRTYLGEQGVGTEIYYPVPLHMQQCFAYLGYRPEDCPESARAARETLALPIYPELEERQLQYVVDTIAAFYRKP
ncbi:MAG TPA: DegT/DnrJ/EryC1/StrS family aminotransferase [Steroidobacteraceae bacterium]|nr:DegT/DnrJ/EryC1/StrS family aminotransferase [Steroidobacteraceae bacterium]